MIEQEDLELSKKLFADIIDAHSMIVQYFGRRASLCHVGFSSDKPLTDELLEQANTLGIDNGINKAYNVMSIDIVQPARSMFGFEYKTYGFYQNKDGKIFSVNPFDPGNLEHLSLHAENKIPPHIEVTLEQFMEKVIDISIEETEHFSKSQIHSFNKLSKSEFLSMYGSIANTVSRVSYIPIYLSQEASQAIAKWGDSESFEGNFTTPMQDEMLCKLKTSTFEHVKFCVLEFYLNNTRFMLYPVNDYAIMCLEYDNQKVIYDVNMMTMFLQNMFQSGVGIAFMEEVHYAKVIPVEVESLYIDPMFRELKASDVPFSYRRVDLTEFGALFSYGQLKDVGHDPKLIRFCHFTIMDDLQIYISKTNPIEMTAELYGKKYKFEDYDHMMEFVFDVTTDLIPNEQARLLKEHTKLVEDSFVVNIIEALKGAKTSTLKHLSKAWKQYISADPIRANNINRNLSILKLRANATPK